jgi:hypothetical protein
MLTQRVNDKAANELLGAADAVEDIDARCDMLPARLDRLADALPLVRRRLRRPGRRRPPIAIGDALTERVPGGHKLRRRLLVGSAHRAE